MVPVWLAPALGQLCCLQRRETNGPMLGRRIIKPACSFQTPVVSTVVAINHHPNAIYVAAINVLTAIYDLAALCRRHVSFHSLRNL